MELAIDFLILLSGRPRNDSSGDVVRIAEVHYGYAYFVHPGAFSVLFIETDSSTKMLEDFIGPAICL